MTRVCVLYPKETFTMVSTIITCVVQVVRRMLARQDQAPPSESDLDALLRVEVLAAVAGGARQAPPPPQREAGQLSLHPANLHHQDGGQ